MGAFALALCTAAQTPDPVLMEINGKKIPRSEFEYIYNKNNSDAAIEKKSLDEYLDMFVNFKLKVAEAEAQGIDTTAAFRKEFANYRSQLAKSYLTDKEADEAFVRKIYGHMQEDVEASHILIRCGEDASPEDTLAAYNKALQARQELMSGADFKTTAAKYSDDPSAKQNGGYLGFFTAMQMVIPFENAAYALQPGEISQPVRTTFGYHVIKLLSRRPDPGKVRVAHIFKYVPQNASDSLMNAAKTQMDSIYNAIQGGADFGELAAKYSDDKMSAKQGGILQWFGLGQTIPAFETKVFAMNVGDLSEPFATPIGLHIVKKLDHKPVPPFDEAKGDIIAKLGKMGENDKGQKALIERLKKDYGMSPINQQTYDMLTNLAPEAILGDSLYLQALNGRNDELFTFAGKSYGAQDFIEFANGYKRFSKRQRATAMHRLMEAYTDKVVLDYEDTQLENKYPEFAMLSNEYRDGILLFDISNMEVWNKASKDEEGLAKCFKKNKKKYKWDAPRFKGIVVHCANDSLEQPVRNILEKYPYEEWSSELRKTFSNDSVKTIKIERDLFVKGENKYVDFFEFGGAKFDAVKDYPHTFVYGKMLKKPESFRDVRGPVSEDYQNQLEEKWIKDLRKKYADKIIIHEDVLKTVNNHN